LAASFRELGALTWSGTLTPHPVKGEGEHGPAEFPIVEASGNRPRWILALLQGDPLSPAPEGTAGYQRPPL
jgi:hypothetical protein